MQVTVNPGDPEPGEPPSQTSDAFPMREYIGAMAAELAAMARHEGDEPLARVLEQAMGMAERQPSTGCSGP